MLTKRRARAERLVAMMDAWWQGRTLREIGASHGITRQRVHVILSRVNCRGGMRRAGADDGSSDSRRRLPSELVVVLRAMLADPLSRRLTTLQRAAIAWGAAGLASRDVGRRMGRSAQVVRELQNSGRWRMMRLAWKAGSARKLGPATNLDFAPLEIEALLGWPAPQDYRNMPH